MKKNFLKHVREQHGINRFSCNQCNYTTNRAYRLDEHKKTHIKNIKKTVAQKVNETLTPKIKKTVTPSHPPNPQSPSQQVSICC